MVGVEDVLTESLGAYIHDWFQPGFAHPFLGLQTVSVPDSVKPIPKRWVEDVEVQIEGDFAADDGDIFADAKPGSWSLDEGKAKLQEALQRLDLSENNVAHPNLNNFDRHQLAHEKRRVKGELKRYDVEFRKQLGRLPTHAEKEPMRPLYVYYRRVKNMITQAEERRPGGRRGGGSNSDDEGLPFQLGVVRESLATIPDLEETPRRGGNRAGNLEDQISSLEARIDSLQNEKSTVRSKLQAFQQKFVTENCRRIKYHKDILPIEREYRMYKNLKEEITKAESQLRDLRREEGNRA